MTQHRHPKSPLNTLISHKFLQNSQFVLVPIGFLSGFKQYFTENIEDCAKKGTCVFETVKFSIFCILWGMTVAPTPEVDEVWERVFYELNGDKGFVVMFLVRFASDIMLYYVINLVVFHGGKKAEFIKTSHIFLFLNCLLANSYGYSFLFCLTLIPRPVKMIFFGILENTQMFYYPLALVLSSIDIYII